MVLGEGNVFYIYVDDSLRTLPYLRAVAQLVEAGRVSQLQTIP